MTGAIPSRAKAAWGKCGPWLWGAEAGALGYGGHRETSTLLLEPGMASDAAV